MRRSDRASSRSLPAVGCGTQSSWPPPLTHKGVKAGTGIRVGPVKVEFAGVLKSTWNANMDKLALPSGSSSMKKFGVPEAGGIGPSRSEGNNEDWFEFCWKHCIVAALPRSILVRSAAQALAPTNSDPARLKLLNVK